MKPHMQRDWLFDGALEAVFIFLATLLTRACNLSVGVAQEIVPAHPRCRCPRCCRIRDAIWRAYQ